MLYTQFLERGNFYPAIPWDQTADVVALQAKAQHKSTNSCVAIGLSAALWTFETCDCGAKQDRFREEVLL